jgi:hypothetical protein
MPFASADGTCKFCHEGLPTACAHVGFFGNSGLNGAQAEALRMPFADGTRYSLAVGEDHTLTPSLLTLSDVLGTGHTPRSSAGVKAGTRLPTLSDAERRKRAVRCPAAADHPLLGPRWPSPTPRSRRPYSTLRPQQQGPSPRRAGPAIMSMRSNPNRRPDGSSAEVADVVGSTAPVRREPPRMSSAAWKGELDRAQRGDARAGAAAQAPDEAPPRRAVVCDLREPGSPATGAGWAPRTLVVWASNERVVP